MSSPQPLQEPDQLIADPAWLLYRADPVRGMAAFLRAEPGQLRRAPFHDERLQQWLGRQPVTAPLEPLLAAAEARASRGAPAVILHTAFCCSTLLTRLLESLPGTHAIREPLVLRDMAMVRVQSNFRHPLDRRLASLLTVVPNGRSRVVIKPSNVVNPLVESLVRWLPDARFLVMTDSLEAFLVSVLKKNPETQNKMAGMARYFLRAAGLEDLFDPDDEMLQHAAAAWAAQRVLLVRDVPDIAWLRAPALLSRDADVIAGMLEALGFPADAENCNEVLGSEHWTRHAKSPEAAFSRDSRRAEARDWTRRCGRRIEAVVAHTGERFRHLDLEPPADSWLDPA